VGVDLSVQHGGGRGGRASGGGFHAWGLDHFGRRFEFAFGFVRAARVGRGELEVVGGVGGQAGDRRRDRHRAGARPRGGAAGGGRSGERRGGEVGGAGGELVGVRARLCGERGGWS